MDSLLFMVAGCFRLSDWDPAMEHDEPGQVGNQAALSRPFLVSDSFSADDFCCWSFFKTDFGVDFSCLAV